MSVPALAACEPTNACTGTQLITMLKRANKWAKIQREAADSMTKAWPQLVPGWRKMLLAYKQDKSKQNPFEEPDIGKSFVRMHNHELNKL